MNGCNIIQETYLRIISDERGESLTIADEDDPMLNVLKQSRNWISKLEAGS